MEKPMLIKGEIYSLGLLGDSWVTNGTYVGEGTFQGRRYHAFEGFDEGEKVHVMLLNEFITTGKRRIIMHSDCSRAGILTAKKTLGDERVPESDKKDITEFLKEIGVQL